MFRFTARQQAEQGVYSGVVLLPHLLDKKLSDALLAEDTLTTGFA